MFVCVVVFDDDWIFFGEDLIDNGYDDKCCSLDLCDGVLVEGDEN